MNDDDIPLEIKPRKGRALEVSSQEDISAQSPVLLTHPEAKMETGIVSGVSEATSDPEQESAPAKFIPPPATPSLSTAEVGEEIAGWQEGAEEIPFILTPARPGRRIEELPPAVGEPERIPPDGRTRKSRPLLGHLLFLVALTLVTLWLVQGIIDWISRLAAFHPLLAPIVYGLASILPLLILLLLYRQYAAYRRLDVLDALRERLERARRLQVSKADDEQLRRDFQVRVEKDAVAQRISAESRRSIFEVMAKATVPGTWVDDASLCLLRDRDRQVKKVIEREARLVGVSTALSPSGPLDTAIVLWRNARLVLRIAEIYGVRPGGYGNYRLLRRVVANMVVAGLSEEAMQMLYAAYGPAVIEAASRGFRSFFDLVSKGGIMLATVEPMTGGLIAAAGALGKGTADFAGATAAQITGPLLQGILNAILTMRIGLAAQNECRLVSLRSQDRRSQSAGIVSALVGFFLSVRRTVPQPVIGIGEVPRITSD